MPIDFDELVGRGAWHTMNGEFDLAMAHLDKAIRLRPDFAEAFFQRGIAFCLKGEIDLALADFAQAIQLCPDIDANVFSWISSYIKSLLTPAKQSDTIGLESELDRIEKTVGMAALKEAVDRRVATTAIDLGASIPSGDLITNVTASLERLTGNVAKIVKLPVPELTTKQIEAIKKRGEQRPWSGRPTRRMDVFKWIGENYKEWIPGLLQTHLKQADPLLYGAFATRISRESGLPDWLDVPSEEEARLRNITDPQERAKMLLAHKLKRDGRRVSGRTRNLPRNSST